MSKCKYIFLDFDGVLNNMRFLDKISKDPLPKFDDGTGISLKEDMSRYLNPENIELVNQLSEKLNWPKFIIHSSWRNYYTTIELRIILHRAGFIGDVVDSTPSFYPEREASIRWWIENNSVKMDEILILEDLAMDPDLSTRQVKTSWYGNGFDNESLKQSIELFSGANV